MINTTLCFLINQDTVLLAMKKRGFGVGKWNGMGGKVLQNESLEEAAIRETREEILVTPQSLQKVAELTFIFPDVPPEKKWNQVCHVYICEKWEGEPVETEEMAPKWFDIARLPFDSMWPGDSLWLPIALQKKKVKAKFNFTAQQEMLSHSVREVKGGFLSHPQKRGSTD